MDLNQIIIYIMVFFAILGGIDKMIGNRFGLGAKFEEGIQSLGALALSMVGILVLAPVIANALKPLVVPMFQAIGADPAMFGGSLLAIDMGGMPLAEELAIQKEAAGFSGIIVGSMLGATIVFTIPVGLGIVKSEDRPYVAKGVLIGVITIPVGVLAGGFTAGYPAMMILHNSVPIVVISLLIVLGVWKCQEAMIKGFVWFGKLITAVITFGMIVGIVAQLIEFQLFEGMMPIMEAFEIIAAIAIILAGAFPMLHVITALFEKPLLKAGGKLGINQTAAAGFIVSLANSIPMFGMLKDMDERGKVVNVAFAVSGAFVLGDHLGFTAGYNPELVVPMIAGKLTAGVSAVVLAMFMMKKERSVKEK